MEKKKDKKSRDRKVGLYIGLGGADDGGCPGDRLLLVLGTKPSFVSRQRRHHASAPGFGPIAVQLRSLDHFTASDQCIPHVHGLFCAGTGSREGFDGTALWAIARLTFPNHVCAPISHLLPWPTPPSAPRLDPGSKRCRGHGTTARMRPPIRPTWPQYFAPYLEVIQFQDCRQVMSLCGGPGWWLQWVRRRIYARLMPALRSRLQTDRDGSDRCWV
jgi:hypothetical protein